MKIMHIVTNNMTCGFGAILTSHYFCYVTRYIIYRMSFLINSNEMGRL